MHISLFTVAVLISLTSCVCEVEEDLTTLQYVYAFFRHGIRTPLYAPYPNDPNKSKYEEYLPGPPGQLSKIGKQIMYKVGEKLKIRYGQFIGDYKDRNEHISSTNMSRTIMTALTVMAGLFPPHKSLFDNLNWQPIPVWEDSTDFDKAVLYNDEDFPQLAIRTCPKYGALIEQGYDKIKNPDTNIERKQLYELLIHYTGKTDVNSVDNLYKVWDTLQFESLNGLPLPSWATHPQPQYNNKPLYPDLMQPIMVEWFRETEYFNNNEDMLQFYTGPLFNSIHMYMNKKIKKPHDQERMRFHTTHDTTLFVLLWALGLQQPKVVGPGDGIIFELHNIDGNSVVKVLYYDTNHNHRVRELKLPRCPYPCYLKQFIKTTQALTPQQYRHRCHDLKLSKRYVKQ